MRVHDPELARPDGAARGAGPADLAGRRRHLARHLGHRRDRRRPGARRALRSAPRPPATGPIYREDGRVTRRTAMTAYVVAAPGLVLVRRHPQRPGRRDRLDLVRDHRVARRGAPRDHLDVLARLVEAAAADGRLLARPRPRRRDRHRRRTTRCRSASTSGCSGAPSRRCALQQAWCGEPCLEDPAAALVRRPAHHRLRVALPRRADPGRRAVGAQPARVGRAGCVATSRCSSPGSRSTSSTRWRRRGWRPATATCAEVHRITSRGWSVVRIDLHRQTMIMWGMGNKVAAMPSLHCGIACLVALLRHLAGCARRGAGCCCSTRWRWRSR